MKTTFALLILIGACSFKKTPLENQTLKGHQELYSEPSRPKLQKLEENEKRIVIASTNDVHGEINPQNFSFEDDHNKKDQTILIGGHKVIDRHFQILKETYKNVVIVDSGDLFSKASDLDSISDFYTSLKYDAVTVGLRDFNLKVPTAIGNNSNLFQKFAKKSKVPLLLSNLYELKTARVVEWEGTKSHLIKEIDGIKVGIIGLIPDDIVPQTPVNNRVGLFVENMLQSTLKHARLLRSLGADVIVVLTHQGIDCGTELSEQSKLPLLKVNFEPHRVDVCDLKNSLGEYLERLPPQLVDVVVGGRNHQKMANFVNGILVMGGLPDGRSFSYAELIVNTKTKRIIQEKTIVHQPVFFCHEFFKETNDCFHEDESVNHKDRVPVKFLGKEIDKNSISSNVSPLKTKIFPNFQEISKSLTHLNADLSYTPDSSGETQLFIMSMKGSELAKILEEDYNHNRKNVWQPSPFLLKNNELTLSISGIEIDLNKTYRILTDLESIQNNRQLLKQVNNFEAEPLMTYSWSSLNEDTISSQLAAQAR